MAETMRSIADLLTITADNTTGAISEQDLRDVIFSLKTRGAGMYISTPVETVIGTVDIPVKVLGTTTLVTPAVDFTMPANNRLQYNGAASVNCVVNAGISISAAANNQDTTMFIYKNGTIIQESSAQRKIGTGADIGRAALNTVVNMVSGDYLEVWVENNTGTANITYENMSFSVHAHLD